MTVAIEPRALTMQMLARLAECPRTDAETTEAWRTSCPRLSTWADAVPGHLVRVAPGERRVGQSMAVELTLDGRSIPDRSGPI